MMSKLEIKSQFDFSQVSIIILNWNNYELTAEALDSVLRNSPDSVEIVLVDNGSGDLVLEQLSERFRDKRVQILKVGVNRFFGEGNNIGAEFANGEFLVFLNNDVVVTSGWLEPLVSELVVDSGVGAVGPKFLYPDGRLQEAGSFLDKYGNSVQRGKGQLDGALQFNSRSEVDYVSAACLAIRKKDFVFLGGFDFIFEPAYYEDTDLCFSLRKMGLSVVYQPKSVVIHKESQTTGSASASGFTGGITEINRRKFLNRWGQDVVNATVSRSGTSHSREHKGNLDVLRTVVLFTPFELIFGGGEKYILSVAQAFALAGYKTIFTTKHKYSRMRIDRLCSEFGLDLSSVEFKLISEVRSGVDLFISMGNEVYPPIRPIGKVNVHHCQFPFPAANSSVEEIERLNLVDLVIVNSQFTRNHYLQSAARLGFTDLVVQVISPPVSDIDDPRITKSPKQIISVGRFFKNGHTKNQYSLIRAFSSVYADHPDSNLVLVGGLAPGEQNLAYLNACIDLADGLPVSFHLDAAAHELQTLVQSSSIYWHGAGLNVDTIENPELCEHFGISLVEAMGAGNIPLVVGNGGPDEIVEFGLDGFKYQSIEGLIRRTSIVFDLSPRSQATLRENARAKFDKYFRSGFDNQWTAVGTLLQK